MADSVQFVVCCVGHSGQFVVCCVGQIVDSL